MVCVTVCVAMNICDPPITRACVCNGKRWIWFMCASEHGKRVIDINNNLPSIRIWHWWSFCVQTNLSFCNHVFSVNMFSILTASKKWKENKTQLSSSQLVSAPSFAVLSRSRGYRITQNVFSFISFIQINAYFVHTANLIIPFCFWIMKHIRCAWSHTYSHANCLAFFGCFRFRVSYDRLKCASRRTRQSRHSYLCSLHI